jgi:ABC-type sugar transport system substrate-binding protein
MALKRTDMTELRGEPGHVWMGSIGSPSEWIEMMKEGKVDYGYVQPNLFYGPLAMYFAIQLIEKGEAGLPNVGQTVTNNPNKPNGHQPDGTYNLVITGYEHLFEPWTLDAQTWFPVEVVTNYEHRWFKVSGMEVTPETADNPSIWGNAAGEWLKPIK